MNVSGERSKSLWMGTADLGDEEQKWAEAVPQAAADVVVVGAGIAGLSTAYELSRAGRSVVVLDRGPIGGGMTARTTAHLASALDDYYHELIRVRGVREARLYYDSQAGAIDRIEAIQRAEAIDCDFRRLDGYLFAATADDVDLLEEEVEACRRIGFSGVRRTGAPIRGARNNFALRFPRQGRFHPLKYLAGLAEAIRRRGGRIHTDSPVTKVEESGGEVTVTTESGPTVRAKAAVIATNSPINDWVAIHTKQHPYRTYAIAGRVPRGAVADALMWDTLDPYHYVRLQPAENGEDWLIVGGEDHKTGKADDMEERLEQLAEWTRYVYPAFREAEYRWSGQVYEPVDYAAFAGVNPGNTNVFVATGDSGQGMTNGVAASMILRDLILGRENPWAEAYAPGRVTPKVVGEYIKENLTMPENYAEYLTPGEVSSPDEIRPGEGAIIREGAAKLAVYRDDSGTLHRRSAVCTHAGCLIHWNSFERCWDCTCHGSQFSVDGEPLQGPAFLPLAEV